MAKIWLITGCSSGFGRILAEAVLARGEQVVVTARNPNTIRDIAERYPATCHVMTLDVTRAGDAAAAAAEAEARFGGLDILVNNAGFGFIGAVEESDPAEYRPIFETNLFGLIETTRAALPALRRSGGGRIVNFSSVGGITGRQGFGLYNATKFAVEGLSEALAQEVAPFGIGVIIVEPGSFRTEFLGRSIATAAKRIEAYDTTSGVTRNYRESDNGQQAGDPERGIAVLLEAIDADTPPLRLPLGKDAYARIDAKLDRVRSDMSLWQAKATATGSAANPVSGAAKQDDRARTRRGWAFGLVAAVIWGGYLAVSRQGIAAGLHASDLAFLRYATAGLLLLPWFLRRLPHRLAGIGWAKSLTLALLAGPLFVLAGASGYLFAPLAHGAVIQLGMLTLMSIALAALLVGERPRAMQLAGLAIIILGLAVTAGTGLLHGASMAWIGDLLFALAGSMWALFTVLQRRWTIAPLAATAVVSVLSGAIYTPLYLVHEGLSRIVHAAPSMLVEQILVQGVLSGVIALFAFARAVQNLGPGRAALFPTLAPGVAILLGIPLAGEVPGGLQIAGLIILTGGLLVAVRGGASAPASGQ